MIKLGVFFVVMILLGTALMYNQKIVRFLMAQKFVSDSIFYRFLGRRVKNWNLRFERRANLNKGSLTFKINRYFKNIIINLDMSKDNVTPAGLVTFIVFISLSASVLFTFWSKQVFLSVPSFLVVFYFVTVAFKFASILLFEKKEAEIMDTEDLIAMDIRGGVYNAIIRYRESFHPNIRPYFEEFIDNVQNKGYGFKQSMLLLNDKLGDNFTSFTQKAILYEEKADSTLEDIFVPVVEFNQRKRRLREVNNRKFKDLRTQFLVSIALIAGFALFSMVSDSFMAHFFEATVWGKLLILFDLFLVTSVLSYLASVKVKFL